jgi:hypothetical protein
MKDADDVLAQIRSCLDAATSRPGLVKATVYQTEGYLRGIQGLAWEIPAAAPPEDEASLFLLEVRKGSVPLHGRIKKGSSASLKTFLRGFFEAFPEAEGKPFARALARLWARWRDDRKKDAVPMGRRTGEILKAEYEEGVAGELSAYLLDDRLHLRRVRDYLRMRGWLRGVVGHLRRRPDWESREKAEILAGNFASIVLRALHNADVGYAAKAVASLPRMTAGLDRAAKRLAATEPEAAHFLRKNRATILTRALHSGYLDYPDRAAEGLPRILKELNRKIARLEIVSPEEARTLRDNAASAVYRALTNGKLDSLE